MGTVKNAKAKVAEKTAKVKANVADKVKKAKSAARAVVAVALAFAAILCGCATSEPASRATTARYEFGNIHLDNKSTLTITLGDGAIASADSTGSTETMTANPTNDVKPDIDVSVPVNKAGAGQSVGSVLGDAVAGLLKGSVSGGKSSGGASADCPDGNCSEGACADGSCNE